MHPYMAQRLVDQHRSDRIRAAESWRAGREFVPAKSLFWTRVFWRIRGMSDGRTRLVPEAGLPTVAVV
jgi:hypothetical protein